MFAFSIIRFLLVTVLITGVCGKLRAGETLQQRVESAVAYLVGAESKFIAPDPQWFLQTQQELRDETKLVESKLDSHGEEYAAAWKKHLRWPLLRGNLGRVEEVKLDELALVRRWLFSNRVGLEYPFFAELRGRTEAHLDAAYTLSQPDLRLSFEQQLEIARRQLYALADNPNDANSAALGRTLGWLEQTRQLPSELASIRQLVSRPNAQIRVRKQFIDRVLALFAEDVEQTLAVSDHTTTKSGGLLGREREVDVYGKAHTEGRVGLQLFENASLAELALVYEGEIESRCRANVGPVVIHMRTAGPVTASSPVQVSLGGVELSETEVEVRVQTSVTGICAENEVIRRLGERRVFQPESMRQMSSRASYKAKKLMQEQMDQRIEVALEEIRSQFLQSKKSMDSFQEVLAPVVREGAAPHWHGLQSTDSALQVNAEARRREQLGAATVCPATGIEADIETRIHLSFVNNMAETIMAGKTFTDKYFMRFARVLQPELPPRLMVHSRTKRWAMIAAKPRPLEISIPAPNVLRFELRMQQVEIGEDVFPGSTIAVVHYAIVENEFGEHELERQGEVELESALPETARDFLLSKLDAFFAKDLNGGGVALPEGGTLGRLRGLKPQGLFADGGWLAFGVNIPAEVLEAWLPEIGE